jgi:hypothetical protein
VVFVKREERQSMDFPLHQQTGHPNSRPSISSVSEWWHDDGEFIEIEFDDRQQSCSGWTVAKTVGQGVAPGGVFGLQGEQFGDGIAPALRPGASVGRSPIAEDGGWLVGLVASAIARLSFGVAERMLSLGLSASRHRLTSVM